MWTGQPQYYVQPAQPPGHIVAPGQPQIIATPSTTGTPQSQTSAESSETAGAGKRSIFLCYACGSF